MRLHFQDTPWDLYIVAGYTVSVTLILSALGVGDVLGIILVLFAPGYSLVAALFPEPISSNTRTGMDWAERLALSFGLSVAIVPLLGLLLNLVPWGIRFFPLIATLALFTLGLSGLAHVRRMNLPPTRRLSFTLELSAPHWGEISAIDRLVVAGLVVSTAIAMSSLVYVAVAPRPQEAFTELYLLGSGENASNYPAYLVTNESATVIVGVANHEGVSMNYTLRIDLVGTKTAYNASAGFNETYDVNRTTTRNISFDLQDGKQYQYTYTFAVGFVGLWRLEFLLFRNADFSSTYHELHLYVTVS